MMCGNMDTRRMLVIVVLPCIVAVVDDDVGSGGVGNMIVFSTSCMT